MIPFRIDDSLLDELTAAAKANPRKRMHYDLRDSADEDSMRMLNAIEPETVIPVHRHTMTSEDVVVLRGKAVEVLYAEVSPTEWGNRLPPEGVITQEEEPVLSFACLEAHANSRRALREVARIPLEVGTSCVACHVPKGMYHTCISLESGTVIIEFKTTRYDAERSEEIWEGQCPEQF